MFERFTEKARRAIFFARYEASQHGTAEIGTPCLLLGILREEKDLMARLLPAGKEELARLSADVEAVFPKAAQKNATSVDLPMSHAALRALAYAAEEGKRLGHNLIDSWHLLLGLLRENGAESACLKGHGIESETVRSGFLHDIPVTARDNRGPLHLLVDKLPADRLDAAATLLEGLAAEKFEVTGAGPGGEFHFSFDDKTE
jgi:ATP-dependent Clp protease ATP-binding subunit ClpC